MLAFSVSGHSRERIHGAIRARGVRVQRFAGFCVEKIPNDSLWLSSFVRVLIALSWR